MTIAFLRAVHSSSDTQSKECAVLQLSLQFFLLLVVLVTERGLRRFTPVLFEAPFTTMPLQIEDTRHIPFAIRPQFKARTPPDFQHTTITVSVASPHRYRPWKEAENNRHDRSVPVLLILKVVRSLRDVR
jgi:hypothetical protein